MELLLRWLRCARRARPAASTLHACAQSKRSEGPRPAGAGRRTAGCAPASRSRLLAQRELSAPGSCCRSPASKLHCSGGRTQDRSQLAAWLACLVLYHLSGYHLPEPRPEPSFRLGWRLQQLGLCFLLLRAPQCQIRTGTQGVVAQRQRVRGERHNAVICRRQLVQQPEWQGALCPPRLRPASQVPCSVSMRRRNCANNGSSGWNTRARSSS